MSKASLAEYPIPMQTDDVRPDRRQLIAEIAQRLLEAHCAEEGVRVVNLVDLSEKEAAPFLAAAEFAVESALSPDRLDVALLAGADAMVSAQYRSTYDPITIFDLSRLSQKNYLAMAMAALEAIRLNLKTVVPDRNYREQIARLMDVLKPKGAQ